MQWWARRDLNPQPRDYESHFTLFCTGLRGAAHPCIRYLIRTCYKIILNRSPLHGNAWKSGKKYPQEYHQNCWGFSRGRPARCESLNCRCQFSSWESSACRGADLLTAASPLYGPYCDTRLQMEPVCITQQLLDAYLGDSALEQATH